VSERWFSPAEMAERLGVSAKALRVYEREGLIKPLRSEAGWRAYGPEQVARLHQVVALKSLGLPLRLIGELLHGRLASLESVLALQQQLLERRREEVDRALQLVFAARQRLAREGALSPDDLIQLTRETAMTDEPKSEDAWREVFEPLIEKHYTPEQIEDIGRRKVEAFAKAGYDAEGFARIWKGLIEEARALKVIGDVDTPRARALVRRWTEMTSHFFSADPELAGKNRAIWAEVTSDPKIAARLPIEPEVFSFLQRIADGMRARGELQPRP